MVTSEVEPIVPEALWNRIQEMLRRRRANRLPVSRYADDLRSLWDVELPESPEHQDVCHEYELRRAQATAVGFERLGSWDR